MNVVLCVLLWAKPGQNDVLVAYEDEVLQFVPEHQGVVRQRVRSDGADDRPLEVQILDFPSRTHLEEFMSDPRRLALKPNRDAAIDKTEVIDVVLVPTQS